MRHPQTLVLALATSLATACGPFSSDPSDFDRLAEASLAQIEGALSVPGLQSEVRILRDEWGIPHIYAQSQDDMFFAQGFVQAQDRLWQIDMWRRTNEGRLAEIVGPEAFEHDRLARLIMFRGSWEEEFSVYHPNGRQIFDRFADGVNAYIDHIGDNLPVEYKLTGLTPLRWTAEASTGRVATALPLGNARAELALARRIAEEGLEAVNRRTRVGHEVWADIVVPEGLDLSLITEDVVEALSHFDAGFPKPPLLPRYQRLSGAMASLNLGAQENSPGSNNWVASGRLTRSGQVLLANDPHRGVTNPSLRYLVHLNAPGYSVIGSTEPGIPGIMIGHNGRIAWGLTVVGTDQGDVFVEQLNPDNPDEALWRDEWYPLEIIIDTIPVLGEAPRIVEHRYSRHGPIFHIDSENHVAFAVRLTSREPGTAGYLGALRLAEVDDCHRFIEAMEYYFAPSENMICGDTDGNIAWLAAALTPSRSGGWYGRLPVPGTGRYEWASFRHHLELPHEINPQRGWLGTTNHDIQPPGYYPPIMFRAMPNSRWDRLGEIFSDARDLTVEDYQQMLHDPVYSWFDRERALFSGWSSEDDVVEWARAEIEAWDGVYDRGSAAAALHSRWRQNLPQDLRPPFVNNDERFAASQQALAQAVADLSEELGHDRSEWRWGRLHRSEFPHWLVGAYDLPAVERSGGSGTIAATGATFRQIIDFADFDNSRATSTPGQSMQPGSPFYGNLLPLWGNQEFFPLLYSSEAVASAAAHRLTLRP